MQISHRTKQATLNMLQPTVLTKYLLIAISCIICAHANADTSYQSLQSIRKKSELFLQDQFSKSKISPEISVGTLDPRLKLPICENELNAFSPQGSATFGSGTVGIRCKGTKPWTIYVPVKVTGYTNVVVIARNVKRGHILSRHDLVYEKRELSRLHNGYYLSINELIGKQLKRPLMRNNIIYQHATEEPDLIKRGQDVMLTAATNGISVEIKAKALSDGKMGQRIRVKNLSSKRVVEGVVIGSHAVKISL